MTAELHDGSRLRERPLPARHVPRRPDRRDLRVLRGAAHEALAPPPRDWVLRTMAITHAGDVFETPATRGTRPDRHRRRRHRLLHLQSRRTRARPAARCRSPIATRAAPSPRSARGRAHHPARRAASADADRRRAGHTIAPGAAHHYANTLRRGRRLSLRRCGPPRGSAGNGGDAVRARGRGQDGRQGARRRRCRWRSSSTCNGDVLESSGARAGCTVWRAESSARIGRARGLRASYPHLRRGVRALAAAGPHRRAGRDPVMTRASLAALALARAVPRR